MAAALTNTIRAVGIRGVGRANQPVEVKAGETATVDLKLEAPKAK